MIKRGLYPFIDDKNTFPKEASGEFVSKTISLIHEETLMSVEIKEIEWRTLFLCVFIIVV